MWSLSKERCDSNDTAIWLCPDCSGRIIASHGHLVCTECGLVTSREFVAPTYTLGDEPSGDHPDVAMYASLGSRLHIVDGLGSYIGFHKERYFRDAHGRTLSAATQHRFTRLKTVYGARIRMGDEETRYRTLRTLNRVVQILMLGKSVRDRAAYIYKKVIADGRITITNNILVIAVCLLASVREFKDEAPVTLEEIATAFMKCGHRINVRAIIHEALRLKIALGQSPNIRRPEDYIPRVLSMLLNHPRVLDKIRVRGWDPSTYENHLRDKMHSVIRAVPVSKRGGRNPFIFAVSVAYAGDRLVASENNTRPVLTQKLTASATNVAEYSIRDHFGMIKTAIQHPSLTHSCASRQA